MSHRVPGFLQRLLGVVPLVIATSFVVLPAATTWADAAGPTDFQSSVVSIDPATPQIHPSIIGGDSFLRLRVDRGTEVDVLGYRSEPFIRFLADGTVEENRASASYLISKSRLGDDLPADFVDDAPPQWHTVADDGDYSWHDHRMHWMSNSDPPGKQPGDVVLQQTVHLLVDGVAVQLVVESVWVAPASTVPTWLGGAAGLAVGAALVVARRRRWSGLLAVDLAALATVVGTWQYLSLPSETGPRPVWFLLPAVALVAAGMAAVLQLRQRTNDLTAHALLLLCGANLVGWGWLRREGFTKAILATDAPGWLDRFATAAAISGGLLAAGCGLAALVHVIVRPVSSPAT